MADQRMYVPPHRRQTFSDTSSLDGQPPSTRGSLFDGSIFNLRRLHLEAPSLASTNANTLKESQSVRRGHGRFGAPPSICTNSLGLDVGSEFEVRSLSGLISDFDDEDLNTASAQYSISTDLDRLSIVTAAPSSGFPTPTPAPNQGRTPSPPPLLLPPSSLPPVHVPRPLIERLGPRYIPPGSMGRSILAQWPTIKIGGGRWNPNPNSDPRGNSDLIQRQRENITKKAIADRPGPSKKSTLLPTFTQIATLFHTLGAEIEQLKPDQVIVRKGEEIRGVEYAGSYKWIESEDGMPTLAVPAVPDIWDPPKVVGKVSHDMTIEAYEEYPDYASALLPPNLSTLEPLFLSLTSPDILQDIDLVTGRNNLRKLWSAMRPDDNHHTSPFRIDIEYIGPQSSSENTGHEFRPGMVILERYEPPNTTRTRHSPTGYHQSYHEATTRKVLDGSDRTPGCNRVIKYDFGGLSMMVKFDTSAFIPDKPNWTEYESGVTNLFDNATDNGQASTIMDGLDFDDPVYNGQAIKIRHTTLSPPPWGICISIKTKSHLDVFDAEYHFPQMYFSQTPRVVYARHQAGNFKFPILHYDLFNDRISEDLQEDRQMAIDKVAGLLRWIVSLARTHQRGLGLVWDGRRFSVCEREEGPQLSAPVQEMIRDVRKKGREESMIGEGEGGS